MKTIAIYNIKGGVGKSTAAVNLACLAASSGHPTLLWDLDAQGAASYYLGMEAAGHTGTGKVLRGKRALHELAVHTRFPLLDVIPARFSYRKMDIRLEREGKPRKALPSTPAAACILLCVGVPGLPCRHQPPGGERFPRRRSAPCSPGPDAPLGAHIRRDRRLLPAQGPGSFPSASLFFTRRAAQKDSPGHHGLFCRAGGPGVHRIHTFPLRHRENGGDPPPGCSLSAALRGGPRLQGALGRDSTKINEELIVTKECSATSSREAAHEGKAMRERRRHGRRSSGSWRSCARA